MTAVCTHTHSHACTRVGFLRTLTLVGLLAAPGPVLHRPRKTNQAVEFSTTLSEDSLICFSPSVLLFPCSGNTRVNSIFSSPTLRPLLLFARCSQWPPSPRGTREGHNQRTGPAGRVGTGRAQGHQEPFFQGSALGATKQSNQEKGELHQLGKLVLRRFWHMLRWKVAL